MLAADLDRRAVAHGDQHDHDADADEDAEHRQRGAQLVRTMPCSAMRSASSASRRRTFHDSGPRRRSATLPAVVEDAPVAQADHAPRACCGDVAARA